MSRNLDPCVDHEQIMCSLCQEIDDLELMANAEANEAWKWAVDNLKEKDPAIAYEHGVRAGFKLGYREALEKIKETK